MHNGGTIAAEVTSCLFDPFRSHRSQTAAREGLGLGLYIVHQLLVAHGGGIEVSSTAEHGRRSACWLPAHLPRRPEPVCGQAAGYYKMTPRPVRIRSCWQPQGCSARSDPIYLTQGRSLFCNRLLGTDCLRGLFSRIIASAAYAGPPSRWAFAVVITAAARTPNELIAAPSRSRR